MDSFDIIGPIMIGPSSSHTAGACKIGNIAASILGEKPLTVTITLYGSFAKTGVGHGTDKALVAGLLGFKSDDIRLRNALKHANDAGVNVKFIRNDKIGLHPNSAKLQLKGQSGSYISIVGSSIGGGRNQISQINDFKVDFSNEHHTIIIIHQDKCGVIASVTNLLASSGVNIASMNLHRNKKGGTAALVIESDHATTDELVAQINK
jgi:L-serine dehydratase